VLPGLPKTVIGAATVLTSSPPFYNCNCTHLVPDMECPQPGDDVQVDGPHAVCLLVVAQRPRLLLKPAMGPNQRARGAGEALR
jgi:hypothetical protein